MQFKKWLLQEALAIKGNYKGGIFQRLVAATYRLGPIIAQEAVPAYLDLAKKIERQHQFLQSKFTFTPTTDDPYTSMRHMSREIDKQKSSGIKRPEIKVFAEPPGSDTGDKGHPLLSNDANVIIRGVHDAIAHYYGQHPFSARGEYGAYNRHLKTLCNTEQVKSGGCLAAKALFTEIIGQTSHYYIYGDYATQKAFIMHDFDHSNVGKLAANSPLNDFFELKNKDLVPKESFDYEYFFSSFPQLANELSKQAGQGMVKLSPLSSDTPEKALSFA